MNSVSSTDIGTPELLFRERGYCLVRGLLANSEVHSVRTHLETRLALGTMRMTGDDQVRNTPCVYGDSVLDNLMERLCPELETQTGFLLYPTYSYARIYKHGDCLPPHRDRPACEISLSLNLGQTPADEPWALQIGESTNSFAAKLLAGDALIYRGMDLTHWREPFEGVSMTQVFLHYVNRDGPYANERFDSRRTLGNAFQPELTGRPILPSIPKLFS